MKELNIFSKLKFKIRKPKAIIILGSNRKSVKEAVFRVLGKHFKIKKNVLFFEGEFSDLDKFDFIIKNSSLPILILSKFDDAFIDKIKKLSSDLFSKGFLIFNYDEDSTRELKFDSPRCLTFGFQARADFQATDFKVSDPGESRQGMNFKVIHKGNIVPVWLENVSDKELIYDVLASVVVGEILGLNLVEISQSLNNLY
jgi:hypothetical protein